MVPYTYQTGGVEALLADLTLQAGQLVVGGVNHREADHTVVQTLETLVYVTFPQH